MTEFVGLRPKTCSYLIDDSTEGAKAKEANKCVIKRRLQFEDYEKCLQNKKTIL